MNKDHQSHLYVVAIVAIVAVFGIFAYMHAGTTSGYTVGSGFASISGGGRMLPTAPGVNPCSFDLTTQGAGSGDPGYGIPDGQITSADIEYFVVLWQEGDSRADLTTQGANVNSARYARPDGLISSSDLLYYTNMWTLYQNTLTQCTNCIDDDDDTFIDMDDPGCFIDPNDEGADNVGPVCGNGVVEAGEQCDDGNTVPGDGCDEFCQDEDTGTGPTTFTDHFTVNVGSNNNVDQSTVVDVVWDGSTRYGPVTSGGDGAIPNSDSRLVSLWHFDGNYNDASGNGHTGSCSSCPSLISGRIGSGAYDFDGTNNAVNVPSLDVTGSAMSVVAWVRPDVLNSNDMRIISKSTGSSEEGHYLMLSTSDTNKLRLRIKTDGGTTTHKGGTLAVGAWNHVAATYDGSAVKLYVNGAPVSVANSGGTVGGPIQGSTALPMVIGNQPTSTGFDGAIDEVAVFDAVLGDSEIANMAGASTIFGQFASPVLSTSGLYYDLIASWTETGSATTMEVSTDGSTWCALNNGASVLGTSCDPGVTGRNGFKYRVTMTGSTEVDRVDFEWNPEAPPVCGNGIVELGEECDDGNTNNADSCSNSCTILYQCNNGVDDDGDGWVDFGSSREDPGCGSSTDDSEANSPLSFVCSNGDDDDSDGDVDGNDPGCVDYQDNDEENPNVPVTGCGCGSTDANVPCAGNSATHTVLGSTFTWNFNCGGGACLCGQFVNGDYWVAPIDNFGTPTGSVQITSISPSGERNGAEVNPGDQGPELGEHEQGILPGDGPSPYPQYRASRNIMTQLPYSASAFDSIIKMDAHEGSCGTQAINGDNAGDPDYGCAASYDVLTVVENVPQNAGSTVFRPPYAGTDKTLFTTDKILWRRLPSMSYVTNNDLEGKASFSEIVQRWESAIYSTNHRNDGEVYWAQKPHNMANYAGSSGLGITYGATLAQYYITDMLSTFGSESSSQKADAVYSLMQQGIDTWGITNAGITFGSGAGQHLGHKPMVTYFAALYDDPTIFNQVSSWAQDPAMHNFYQFDTQIYEGRDGVVLWGDHYNSARCGIDNDPAQFLNHIAYYWGGQASAGCTSCDRTLCDPYGYIDGPSTGPLIDRSYMWGTAAGPAIMFSIAQHLMPALKAANNDWEILTYADRVYDGYGMPGFPGGAWADPDPCAPTDPRERSACDLRYWDNPDGDLHNPVWRPGWSPDGPIDVSCDYFMVTYGPDPNDPSECIHGSGRYTEQHGQHVELIGGGNFRRLVGIGTDLWSNFRACADSGTCSGMGQYP